MLHFRVVIIEVGLGGIEAVPEILAAQLVKSPIGGFGIGKDDACFFVFLISIGPNIPVTIFGVFGVEGIARCLEPGMLVGGVVGDDFDDDAQTAQVGFLHQGFEVIHGAIGGENVTKIADVITVVAQWGGHDWQKPDRINSQAFDVVQFTGEPGQIAPTIAIGILKSARVQFHENGIFIPGYFLCHFILQNK